MTACTGQFTLTHIAVTTVNRLNTAWDDQQQQLRHVGSNAAGADSHEADMQLDTMRCIRQHKECMSTFFSFGKLTDSR